MDLSGNRPARKGKIIKITRDENGVSNIDWEKIFDRMPEAVAIVNDRYRFEWVNCSMEAFLDLPREEILGKTCYSLVHKTGGPIEACPFQRLKAGGGRETMELEIPERGLWLRVSVDPMLDGEGRFAGAIHFISDLTPVRRAEQELGGRLLSLMNNIPGVVYRGLRDWSVVFIGADVERITGSTAEEFLSGKAKWRDLIHPDDLEHVKNTFREAVRSGRKVLQVEYRAVHKDGTVRWISDRRQLFYDDDGAFAYVDGLLLDVSPRKQAEEELRDTHDKLQALIEASPLAIMSLTPEGIVTMWNPAAERIFGWSEAEVIGRPNPIVPENKQKEFRALRERVMSGEGLSNVELRRLGKNGFPLDISLSSAPLRDHAGVPKGIVAVIADITERKRMEDALRKSEDQLRQSQKMEAIGRLAGGVAHDFNNLLTVIRGYSDLLLLRLDGGSPMRREVEEIQKAGERASSLTRQLLAFSRKQVLQPKMMDLNAIVADTDKMLRRLIGEDIDLVTVLKPDLGLVLVDPGQVEQVLMNLVVNARDAMPRGGKVTIETANVVLGECYSKEHRIVKAGQYVMLAISDTGVGMDEKTKTHLFEPFFTTKKKGKGTGLGLSTVYGIVKQSGGYVWVYSEVGQGATFKVYFPRHDGAGAETETEAGGSPSPAGRETVLVVEDEEVVRALVRQILEDSGYTVLTASDGEEAIEVATASKIPVHLVVTDIIMPKMGGREAARSLEKIFPGVSILYMSGYTDEAIVHHGVLESGISFLEKPFTPDALLRKVREVLNLRTKGQSRGLP
jgi:PAS domain S-box-containing protein